jgi:hypothetical protein
LASPERESHDSTLRWPPPPLDELDDTGQAPLSETITVNEYYEVLPGLGWPSPPAARAGMSTSAWLSAAARREAVRLGAGSDWGDPHADALADDADLAVAEAELRAAG